MLIRFATTSPDFRRSSSVFAKLCWRLPARAGSQRIGGDPQRAILRARYTFWTNWLISARTLVSIGENRVSITEITTHYRKVGTMLLLEFWGLGGPEERLPNPDRNTGRGNISMGSPKDMKADFIKDSQDHLTELGVAELRIIAKYSILFVVRGMILAHTFPVGIAVRELTINQDIRALTPHSGLVPTVFATSTST